jgi:hypothetical protein
VDASLSEERVDICGGMVVFVPSNALGVASLGGTMPITRLPFAP